MEEDQQNTKTVSIKMVGEPEMSFTDVAAHGPLDKSPFFILRTVKDVVGEGSKLTGRKIQEWMFLLGQMQYVRVDA